MLVNTAVTEGETREQISKVNGQSFPEDVSAMKKVEDGRQNCTEARAIQVRRKDLS